jgi:cytoskeletal protein CcmA (bactofilin family)
MFDKRASGAVTPSTEILGFLGEGTLVKGDLTLAGAIRLDGRIEGRVTSPSTLVVGPTGSIESPEMRVHTLSVAGVVSGVVRVEDRLEIQPGGLVSGRVIMRRKGLAVAPGGRFEGTLEMDEGDETR